MWAIIDSRAPKEAIEKLKETFDVLEFRSKGITYDQISGHPDIFIFQDEKQLIIAPNSPKELTDFLNKHKVDFIFGKKEVGTELNNSTQYNCIVTKNHVFHKKGFSDETILKAHINKELVNLPQAYTRCSLTKLNYKNFITSDVGIHKALTKHSFISLLVSPKNIKLPGYPYGFFGGTNGIHQNNFYLIGSLDHIDNSKVIREFISKNKLNLIELYNGPLYDGGGIFIGL
jgi:hypothetical protein